MDDPRCCLCPAHRLPRAKATEVMLQTDKQGTLQAAGQRRAGVQSPQHQPCSF